MKKIFVFFEIIIAIFLIIFFNCQQNTSSGGGGGGSKNESSSLKAIKIAIGAYHTIVISENGTVKCWGNNSVGQLGYEDTSNRGDDPYEMGNFLPIIDLGTGRAAVQIAAGENFAAALLDNGSIKCWGYNHYGQLGYGNLTAYGDNPGEMGDTLPTVDLGTGRTAVQIAAGNAHTVVLLDDGTVKCWGWNNYGQLGYEDTIQRGDNSGEMGDTLPTVDLGTGRTAVQIAAGGYHTVVLLDDGTVKCWGYNGSGQLGYGDTNNRGDNSGEMGDTLPTVDLGTGRTAVQIAAGGYHTVVLLDDGTVKCWGYNSFGQLGYGDGNSRGDNPGEMGDTLPAVDLGTGRTAAQIAAGSEFTAVLLDNGTIKCWGRNDYGQLGYGDGNSRGDNPGEMGDALPAVDLGTGRTAAQIAAGSEFTAVLLDNGTIKCWGRNNYGQLGYGDTENRGDNSDEMGDNLLVVDLW